MLTTEDPKLIHTNPSASRCFGLSESPFSSDPDVRFLVEIGSMAGARDQVLRAVTRREGLVAVTGASGAGKSLLIQLVIDRLRELPGRTPSSVIDGASVSADELLERVLHDLGAAPSHTESGANPVRATQQFLASLASSGSRAVILIDNAHRLSGPALERITWLSTFETESDKLLQIVLVGQPTLDEALSAPECRQLKQRISRRVQLAPLRGRELRDYIERRLWKAHGGAAGLSREPGGAFWRVRFTPSAIRTIDALTLGVPGTINTLCDRSLEIASQRRSSRVDGATVIAAAKTLGLEAPVPVRLLSRVSFVTAGSAAALAVTLLVFLPWRLAGDSSGTASAATDAPPSASSGAAPPEATAGGAAPTVAPLVEAETFAVVAASFRAADRADALAAKAAGVGLPAFTRVIDGSWYQVVVGPYASRDEARRAQERLKAADIGDAQIVATPPRSG